MDKYSKQEEVHKDMAAEPVAMYSTDMNALRNRGVELLMNIEDASTLSLVVHDIESKLRANSDKQRFYALLDQWERETGVISNPVLITSNANFQAIIEMGKRSVPFIREEIEKRPSLLYRALELIYGEQLTEPVNEHGIACINIKDSCEAWIEKLKFETLFEKWWQETGIYSGPNLCFSNDNFKAMKSMGETIIPLIDAKLLTAPTYMHRHLKWLRNTLSKATSTERCIAI